MLNHRLIFDSAVKVRKLGLDQLLRKALHLLRNLAAVMTDAGHSRKRSVFELGYK